MEIIVGRPFEVSPIRKTGRKKVLNTLLRLPASERSDRDLYEISKHLTTNGFLSKFAATGQLQELARYMTLQFFENMTYIFKEGDVGDSFYIIHSGRVAVYKKIGFEHKKLRELGRTNFFGEKALLEDELRSASILCLEDTELIVLNKECFDKIVKKSHEHYYQRAKKFFQGISALPEMLVEDFARKAYLKNYMPNEYIIRQGEYPTGIYFLVTGSAQVIKNAEFAKVIDEVQIGDSMCDYCYFYKKNSDHSIICTLPSSAYFISKEELMTITFSLLSEYKKALKPYPDVRDINKIYKEKLRWVKFRENVYKSVKLEKGLKRNFDSSLRQPVIIPRKICKFQHKFMRSKTTTKRFFMSRKLISDQILSPL